MSRAPGRPLPRRCRAMFLRVALPLLAGMPAGAAGAGQAALLQDGAYAVEVRLELPNVLSRGPDSTRTICLPYAETNGAPLPVLSANNPLGKCAAANVERDGAALRFDLVCEGRGAAWAHAVYKLMPAAFEGRIAMVMGGKNMTMTEVQIGRRIGPCDPPSTPSG
jgi:Protein of unknown function (DUF3617)